MTTPHTETRHHSLQTVNPWSWQDVFGYAQGILVSGAARTLYVAGQGSIDADGNPVHGGDMAGQVAQAMSNLEQVLEHAGMSLADVVRYDVHTTDIDSFLPASHLVVERFAAHDHLPAGGILAQVSRLAMPPMMVEISAIAVG